MSRLLRLLGFLVVLLHLTANGGAQQARRPLDTGPVRKFPLRQAAGPGEPAFLGQQLVVKFSDHLRVRSNGSGGVSTAGSSVGVVQSLAFTRGLTFRPLIQLPEAKLAALEERARARSGVEQPDLAGMFVVEQAGASLAELARTGQALADSGEVEFAVLETLGVPPPGDIAPTTPDLSERQRFRGTNPGLDVSYAWSQGLRGAGIRLSDCEYGWARSHEDLIDVDTHLEPGQTIHPSVFANGWEQHGTAVLGEASAPANGYGVSGIAVDSPVFTYPEWSQQQGFRRSTCIASALADSAAGDVVLLEMQDVGPGGSYAPAETNPIVFTLVKTGTDAGVVVVAAAGNGDQNLDSRAYATYRSWGDSGAILVGAGTSNANHDTLFFSTFGSRVNVQGWGDSVFSLGYGDFAAYGGDPDQKYTAYFGGTSSAAGMLAPVCCILQQAAVRFRGERLQPLELRALLVETGIPQGAGGKIGPFPDLERAILALQADAIVPVDFATIEVAVRAAQDADGDGRIAILVRSGTYLGNVRISRSHVHLLGEDQPILQGDGTSDVIRVAPRSNRRDLVDVVIQGFTVTGGGPDGEGIEFTRVIGGRISDNRVTGNDEGILLSRTSGVVVAGNHVGSNRDNGIRSSRGASIVIEENEVVANGERGIELARSSDGRVLRNRVSANEDNGLYLNRSHSVVVDGNEFLESGENGMRLNGTRFAVLSDNRSEANEEDGLRMEDTDRSLVTSNRLIGNDDFGIRTRHGDDDDFGNAPGIQRPVGDNQVSGNAKGALSTDGRR